jgi:hypothetical protein
MEQSTSSADISIDGNAYVNKNWEIYWNADDNTDPFSESTEEDEDWYDARIVSYDDAKHVFDVIFVGEEDNVYQLQLPAASIKPSLSDWTKVANDLLHYEISSVIDTAV